MSVIHLKERRCIFVSGFILYLGAFQDPTHNNIMTVDTFRLYFSEDKYDVLITELQKIELLSKKCTDNI